jgi:competence protein ComEC
LRNLVIFSLGFAAAVFAAVYFLPERVRVYCAVGLAAICPLCLLLRGNARTRYLLVCASASMGLLWFTAYNMITVAPAREYYGSERDVTAVAADYPTATRYGVSVPATISDGAGRVKALIYINTGHPDISPGDTLTLTASFRAADAGFDDDGIGYNATRGYFLAGYVTGEVEVTPGGGIRYLPRVFARAFGERLGALFGDISPFMRALILGDTAELRADERLYSALGVTGVTHIVSVSGMHVAYLMGMVTLLIRNKRRLAIIGIPLLLMFLAVIGFSPPVTRSVIMYMFVLIAPLVRRRSDGLTSLFAALLLIVADNPYCVGGTGLQLSFLASAGIILFAGRIQSSLSSRIDAGLPRGKLLPPVLRFIAASFSTTVSALVFTLPVSAYRFGYISVISPVTNLVTLTAVSVAFVGGVMAGGLSFLLPLFGEAAAYIASLFARFTLFAVRTLARIPFAAVYVSNPYVLFYLVYVYALVFVCFISRKTAKYAFVIPACLAAVSLCAVMLFSALTTQSGMSVTALDVGQGQSIVVSADELFMVVDCGGSGGAGGDAVSYLHSQGTGRVALLVLTHFHSDHVSGVIELLSRMRVGALVIPSTEEEPENGAAFDIISLARERQTDIIVVETPMSFTLGDAEIYVYPPVGAVGENERGLTILCTDGEFDALITGDMDDRSERRLLDTYDLPDIEVLIAGHHGSKYATTDELLETTRPEVAIISVGRNTYGHPAAQTLEKLQSNGIAVYRTDETGNVTVKCE